MSLEYKVVLPDHDFVKAARHKLIPSVYAALEIDCSGNIGDPRRVTYSGPTYIAIRSAKHDTSTALSHAFDIDTLMTVPEFTSHLRTTDGAVKPVLLIISDGGPDENPRYEKVQQSAIETFQKYDLDAIFLATNAPGRSAYNAVERRMAPLSRCLAGLLLRHDAYGSHLDESGKTTDAEMEYKNFKAAGELLASVWKDTIIDGHPVIAEFREPGSERQPSRIVSPSWITRHVRSAQYIFQITKCNDASCCKPRRSDIGLILPKRFLPPPISVSSGLHPQINGAAFLPLFITQVIMAADITLPDDIKLGLPAICSSERYPYDMFMPSARDTNILLHRTCTRCGLYHCSAKMLALHMKDHYSSAAADVPKIRPTRIAARRQREIMAVLANEERMWMDEEEVDAEGLPRTEPRVSNAIPVIEPKDALSPVWEDL